MDDKKSRLGPEDQVLMKAFDVLKKAEEAVNQPELKPDKHWLRLDVSKLDAKQRQELTTKLKELSRGIAPEGVGSLVSAEGNHSSHNDTDGWF
ncbi:MAG: hypothetical protein P0119_22260 [Nitrospira sp.]|nr:hypothetical protein [Nitrospira sp.]